MTSCRSVVCVLVSLVHLLLAADFCHFEKFQAHCARDDSVILMTSALYGRMKGDNRCIDGDLGNLGCYGDVMTLADARCSGRRRCDVAVPDQSFDSYSKCHRDLAKYLSVTFDCVKVYKPRPGECFGQEPVAVTQVEEGGYLASTVTEETGCGSTVTPWRLEVKVGQRITFTLFDFGLANSSSGAPSGEQPLSASSATQCQVYAVIREPQLGRSYTVCSGTERQHVVYVTLSSVVEVRLMTGFRGKAKSAFLLRYDVTGCADPDLDENDTVYERAGNDVTVTCRATGQSWQLHCINNTWHGNQGNCTAAAVISAKSTGAVTFGEIYMTKPFSLILMAVVAATIGISILILGFVYIRRRRVSHTSQDYLPAGVNYDVNGITKDTYYKALGLRHPGYPFHGGHVMMTSSDMAGGGGGAVAEENEYEYVDDLIWRYSRQSAAAAAARTPDHVTAPLQVPPPPFLPPHRGFNRDVEYSAAAEAASSIRSPPHQLNSRCPTHGHGATLLARSPYLGAEHSMMIDMNDKLWAHGQQYQQQRCGDADQLKDYRSPERDSQHHRRAQSHYSQ